jgi:anaerobic magnesium-protoporphyrin IX monomethyl ester cyclase
MLAAPGIPCGRGLLASDWGEKLLMKVALVGPKWNQMVNSYPALGLGYLAAMIEQAGHECAIFDMGLRPKLSIEEEVEKIVAWGPDVIAETSMTTSWHSIEVANALLKDRLGVPIIAGGPHATTLPVYTAKDPNVDFVVYGEGEETFAELIDFLDQGRTDFDKVAGIYYQKDKQGEVIQTAPRMLVADLDALPFPARHLFELDQYPLYNPNGQRMLTVLSSRGCPYVCSFCFKGIVGRTYRQRTPENIAAEVVEIIEKYQVQNIYFIDDLFTIDVRRLEKIMDHFIQEDLPVNWQCLARVDRVTQPLLEKMYRAGCREIHYGIESGDENILKETAKHINLKQVHDAVKWTEAAGIRAKGYFILGLPGDNEETMERTIEFAASLPLSEAMFSIATPMPGTKLWDELVKRRPETEYSTDWAKSYYYNSYTSEIAPFMNVSNVSDEVLAKMAIHARERFLEEKRRRRYSQYFGSEWGDALYRISRNDTVRAVGRTALKFGALPGFKQLKQKGNKGLWESSDITQ